MEKQSYKKQPYPCCPPGMIEAICSRMSFKGALKWIYLWIYTALWPIIYPRIIYAVARVYCIFCDIILVDLIIYFGVTSLIYVPTPGEIILNVMGI